MSKSVLIIVIAVIAAAAGGGAYHVLTQQQPAAVAPPITPPHELPNTASPQKPAPDHGSFQNRFQPSMPPAEGK
ncbi:hypothetical protein DBA29_26675 [Xenophilus aerolatus]|nr:hypothetical protein [Xenophilus aerolatus]